MIFLSLLSMLVLSAHALKVFDSLNATEHKNYYHRTAAFGPQPGDYNVSAPLLLVHPVAACSLDKYIQDDGSLSYNPIYQNSIVLILRGNCTFSKKVRNAQLLGAVGVIVGDYNTSADEWIVMSNDPSSSSGTSIRIPAVFVPHRTYQAILKLLASSSFDSLSTSQRSAQVVMAMLDSDGEYLADSNTFWLAAFGIVLIIIPTLWCFIVCVALLRRKLVRHVERSRRSRHLSQIPIVLYACNVVNAKSVSVHSNACLTGLDANDKAEADSYMKLANVASDSAGNGEECKADEAVSIARNLKQMSKVLLGSFRGKKEYCHPLNDSCAVCLDDFEVGDAFRLLPCNHGFHKHCIDPWLTKSSELCPMCKQSIFMNEERAVDKTGRCLSLSSVCCIRNVANRNRQNGRNPILRGEDRQEDNSDVVVLSQSQDELVSIESESSRSESM